MLVLQVQKMIYLHQQLQPAADLWFISTTWSSSTGTICFDCKNSVDEQGCRMCLIQAHNTLRRTDNSPYHMPVKERKVSKIIAGCGCQTPSSGTPRRAFPLLMLHMLQL